jgi:alkylation response protein AidB-like acyl-CoA dehydrogenase
MNGVPVLLSGSEELKKRYLAPVARGAAMFSYALSEAEAGSDAAGMRTRAVHEGDGVAGETRAGFVQ